jgi:hypothetical protein
MRNYLCSAWLLLTGRQRTSSSQTSVGNILANSPLSGSVIDVASFSASPVACMWMRQCMFIVFNLGRVNSTVDVTDSDELPLAEVSTCGSEQLVGVVVHCFPVPSLRHLVLHNAVSVQHVEDMTAAHAVSKLLNSIAMSFTMRGCSCMMG